MAVTVTIDGTGFNFPQTGDEAWGDTVTSWAVAVSSKLLQRSGGSFPLSAEVDFGASFGLKSLYYKSRNANVANAGQFRLGNTETVSWRNAANSADLPLTVTSGNVLTFNSIALITASDTIPVNRGGTGITSYTIGDILWANGTSSLAKLAIGANNTVMTSTGSAPQWGLLVDANLSATADITLSKVNGGTANRIIASSGASNRLAVLAAITNGHVLYADANGLPIGEAFLSKSRGGAGADMSSVTFPTTGTLVTRTATEALTNKDYDGGTASNTSRLTVPQGPLATLQGLTRKEATLLYANDVDRLYIDNGSILSAVGAGSGSINYCSNPDAEASTSGWATYADAAGTAPVDGTGGSPNITWTRTTTSPLEGLASFLLTKDAANRQGQGVSFDFTIATGDLGKQIAVSFIAQTDTSYAAGDILVYAVDVTNSTVIQLQGASVLKADSSGGAAFTGIFQASSNSTSYRLCLHIATTNAAAFTVEVDRVTISPSSVALASPVTDPVSYTPTLNSNTNVSSNTARWWRSGRYMFIEGAVLYSGAGAAGTFTVSTPSGFTQDLTNAPINSGDGASQPCGFWGWFDNSGSAASRGGYIRSSGSGTTFTFVRNDTSNGVDSSAFAASDIVLYQIRIPIVGWGSNVQVGSYDGRTVAARYTSSSSSMTTSPTTVTFPTRDYDTHGAYNTATGVFTAPVAGYYRAVCGARTASASWVANNGFFFNFRKNSSIFKTNYNYAAVTASFQLGGQGACEIFLNAGDTLDLQLQNSQSAALSGNAVDNVFEISLVPGRSTLSAGDIVAFAATKASGSASNGTADVASYTTDFDLTGSFNATTGVFTAPIAGIYAGDACVSFAANATGSRSLEIQVNGSGTARTGPRIPGTAANDVGISLSFTLRLNAGDTVRVRSVQSSGGALNFSTVTAATSFSMRKTG